MVVHRFHNAWNIFKTSLSFILKDKSSYEGKPIEEIYMSNVKADVLQLILKLKRVLKEVLEK